MALHRAVRQVWMGLVLAAAGCTGGDGGTTPPVQVTLTSITVSPSTATLAVGSTATLTAALTGSNGQPFGSATVTWTSETPAVATVAGNGSSATVTAVAAGTATLRASSGAVSGTATVTVSLPPVARVAITLAARSLLRGDSAIAGAATFDAANAALSGRTIAWTSSNPAVASVGGTGVVRAIARGSAVIRAASEGRSDSVAVTVRSVSQVSVSPDSVNARPTTTTTLTASVVADSAVSTGVSWRSLDPGAASVSASGVVSAISIGRARIEVRSAFDSTVRDTALVIVPDPCAPLALTIGLPVVDRYEASDCAGVVDLFRYVVAAPSVLRFEVSGSDSAQFYPIDRLAPFGTPLGATDRVRFAAVRAGTYDARLTLRDLSSRGNAYQLATATLAQLPACAAASVSRGVTFGGELQAQCDVQFYSAVPDRPGLVFSTLAIIGDAFGVSATAANFPVYLEVRVSGLGSFSATAVAAGETVSVSVPPATLGWTYQILVTSATPGGVGQVTVTVNP